MRCVETRTGDDGFKRRRYITDSGNRESTIEVPLDLWRKLNRQGRCGDRAQQWLRARQREQIKSLALALAAQGWKPEAIANECKVPTRTVQRWRKEANGNQGQPG